MCSRLIISTAKSQSGARYSYFICTAKHNKRNNCRQKSLLIDEVAGKIEELYKCISFTKEFKELVKQWLNSQLSKIADESKVQPVRLKKQKDKLEREQKKFLQAHYADAIPLDLLKEEQNRISTSLKSLSTQITAHQTEYTELANNLSCVFDLLENCEKAYDLAGDFERRCFNQALIKRILVHENLTLDVEYAEPFDIFLNTPFITLKQAFDTIKIFFTAGLSMDCLVRTTGLELKS